MNVLFFCVCRTVWLGADKSLDERLVMSHNFYKADLERQALGHVTTIPVDVDTRTRVQNVLIHSALPYAETLRNARFMLGSYCRNWCSLCEVVCFCWNSLTGESGNGWVEV